MEDILSQIVANKRREVAAKPQNPFRHYRHYEPVSMADALTASPTGIIAEFKRRSPSKGEIHPMADVASVVPGYEAAGAAACSVLTDTRFFGGSLDDLLSARAAARLPLLRKEFIIDPRQIAEARACGADAVLLIASVLTAAEIERFTTAAHQMGLEVLLELHSESEIGKIDPHVDMIGVNNRDLHTFATSIDHTVRMASLLPDGPVKVAESGLSSPDQVAMLRRAGYRGFLMGERFMKEDDPAAALASFINSINQ